MGLLVIAGVEDVLAVRAPVERDQLLLLVGHAWRKRREVPVDVRVPLLRAEAEDVQPLGRSGSTQCLSDAVDDALQLDVLLFGEVGGDFLDVPLGSYKGVSTEGRVAIEERDCMLVLVDHVVRRASGDELADEARTFASSSMVGANVHECPQGV
jgi:hypothetical protein